MPRIVILDPPHSSYHRIFSTNGWDISETWTLEKDVDLVLFTGGTDVNPSYYGQGRHAYTQHPDVERDALEKKIFLKCIELGIPMVGICRGAQFLCVGNGGTLIQHVSNHAIGGHHKIITTQGTFHASSSHHQMMYPFDVEHEILGYAEGLSHTYQGATKDGITAIMKIPNLPHDHNNHVIEPEVVFFPQSNSLCHQPHPEWQEKSEYCEYFFNTIKQYLGVSV